MEELFEWLKANKIAFKPIDNEVIEIVGLGKVFFTDTEEQVSIFKLKPGSHDEVELNLMETPEVLMQEGIFYVTFKFGNNWYYHDMRGDFKLNILKYVGERQPVELQNPPQFVNLGVHTPFELLNGSGSLAEWVGKAKYLGQPAIGVCDVNTMASLFNLQKACNKAGIKPVFGYSTIMTDEIGSQVDIKIYCNSQDGLQNLLRVQKEVMVDSEAHVIHYDQLAKRAEGNALVLGKYSSAWIVENPLIIQKLYEAFAGRIYFQVDFSEFKAERIDVEVLNAMKIYFEEIYSEATILPPVLITDQYYLDQDDARNKIILNKIAIGAAHEQSNDQYFKDLDELWASFSSMFDETKRDVRALFDEACNNTVKIAENATAEFAMGRMYMPEYVMLPEEIEKYGTRHNMFLQLIEEGMQRKCPPEREKEYRDRLRDEVYVIESTNNVDYFLVQWDMIKEAQKRGIVTGIGRGSAGGSLVSYLLDIILINPMDYGLIFSRFLVPERCGLGWIDEISVLAPSVAVEPGDEYVEIELDGRTIKVNIDSEFMVKRGEEEMAVYADELQPDDEILFDNRDIVWTLNEIKY